MLKESRRVCFVPLVDARPTMQFQRRPRLYAAARLRQIVLKTRAVSDDQIRERVIFMRMQ